MLLSSLVVVLSTAMANSESFLPYHYKDYDWVPNPSLHQLTAAEAQEFEIILMDKTSVEFIYDVMLYELYLVHKIVRVNSDEAIEKNNKVYIPLSNVLEVIKHKGRVIKPDGQVVELKESDIREASDEEGQHSYKYFAFEGVEKGSEIEYFYYVKTVPLFTGAKEVFQSQIPRKNISFEIISPENLLFSAKSYNGFPDLKMDTTLPDKLRLHAHVEAIPSLAQERIAAYGPNLMHVIYKLDHNTIINTENVISYGSAAEAVKHKIYDGYTKNDRKKIKQLIKSMDISDGETMENKIRKVEQYLKTNYRIVSSGLDGLGEISKIIDNKICSRDGMVRMFAAIFDRLAIDHHLVMTSNRFQVRFDKDFESYNFLDEYLIYFPELDNYLVPSIPLYRFGIVPYQWTNNYGLFISRVRSGEYETSLGKVNFIQPAAYTDNMDLLNIEVEFPDSFDELYLDVERDMHGQYAMIFQPLFDYVSEEERQEFSESVVKFISEDVEVNDLTIFNEGTANVGLKPFRAKARLTSDAFIEKAGNKYLFKVGELIGPQLEMYQEEERKLEVENQFNRKYFRTITFDVPKGYKVSNLNALKMDIYHQEDSDRTMTFSSEYTLTDKRVTIEIEEYYKKINYPVETFEKFRQVINAAADFNKVVLFIEEE